MARRLSIAIVSIDDPVYASGMVKKIIADFAQEVKFVCEVPFQVKGKITSI